VQETGIIERIFINILAGLRGHNTHGRYKEFKRNIIVKVILVNTGNVGVSSSGLFESGLQQKVCRTFIFC